MICAERRSYESMQHMRVDIQESLLAWPGSPRAILSSCHARTVWMCTTRNVSLETSAVICLQKQHKAKSSQRQRLLPVPRYMLKSASTTWDSICKFVTKATTCRFFFCIMHIVVMSFWCAHKRNMLQHTSTFSCHRCRKAFAMQVLYKKAQRSMAIICVEIGSQVSTQHRDLSCRPLLVLLKWSQYTYVS